MGVASESEATRQNRPPWRRESVAGVIIAAGALATVGVLGGLHGGAVGSRVLGSIAEEG